MLAMAVPFTVRAQEEEFSSFRNEEEEGAGAEESAIDAELAEQESREAEHVLQSELLIELKNQIL